MIYYVMANEWNGRDYDFVIKAEGEDLDEIKETFEGLEVGSDRPLIELYEAGEDDEKRIAYREA